MEKIELLLVALSASLSQPGYFALILEEPVSRRRIPVVIGHAEAQAIAMALENLVPPRPLTHDLFCNTLQNLGYTLQEVVITHYEADVFYAQLVLKGATSQGPLIDARPSDAIALAVRLGSPVYTTAAVLAAAAYEPDELSQADPASYLAYTLEELENLLLLALQEEDYARAAWLRDALEYRKKLL